VQVKEGVVVQKRTDYWYLNRGGDGMVLYHDVEDGLVPGKSEHCSKGFGCLCRANCMQNGEPLLEKKLELNKDGCNLFSQAGACLS
jgi:hypothetical protein